MRIVVRDPKREFMQAGLAHEHGAGLGEFPINLAIAIRDVVREDLRSGSGADAARFEEIFERIGDAVQRAAIDAARQFFIRAPGLCEREFFRDRDERVQQRLLLPDAVERFLGQFDRGNFARAKFCRRLFDSSFGFGVRQFLQQRTKCFLERIERRGEFRQVFRRDIELARLGNGVPIGHHALL